MIQIHNLCGVRSLNVSFMITYVFLCLLFSFLFLFLLLTLQLRIAFLLRRQQLPDFNSTLHRKPSITLKRERGKVRRLREIMKAIRAAVGCGQGLQPVIKHKPACKQTSTFMDSHLLLQGLQVHLSIGVVDGRR